MSQSKKIIDAQNISRTFHTDEVATTALHETSVTINQGEFIAIMGPSGSGKSTLLHILGLLDRTSTGTYFFNDQDVSQLEDAELAHLRNRTIGFIFQAFHLLNRTSVIENVMLPLQYSSVPQADHKQKAEQALDKVGLAHRLYHRPSQLSGGEKQRTVIARALVTEPQVLFADEPTGNLDSRTGHTIMTDIDRLNHEGLTVILITHEHDIAAHAKRTITLTDGRIISDEPQKQSPPAMQVKAKVNASSSQATSPNNNESHRS